MLVVFMRRGGGSVLGGVVSTEVGVVLPRQSTASYKINVHYDTGYFVRV